jgi:hypothetical protein
MAKEYSLSTTSTSPSTSTTSSSTSTTPSSTSTTPSSTSTTSTKSPSPRTSTTKSQSANVKLPAIPQSAKAIPQSAKAIPQLVVANAPRGVASAQSAKAIPQRRVRAIPQLSVANAPRGVASSQRSSRTNVQRQAIAIPNSDSDMVREYSLSSREQKSVAPIPLKTNKTHIVNNVSKKQSSKLSNKPSLRSVQKVGVPSLKRKDNIQKTKSKKSSNSNKQEIILNTNVKTSILAIVSAIFYLIFS